MADPRPRHDAKSELLAAMDLVEKLQALDVGEISLREVALAHALMMVQACTLLGRDPFEVVNVAAMLLANSGVTDRALRESGYSTPSNPHPPSDDDPPRE